MLAEVLFVQVETLLYQRELAADTSMPPAVGNRNQRLKDLDAKVRPAARTAAKQILDNVRFAVSGDAKLKS